MEKVTKTGPSQTDRDDLANRARLARGFSQSSGMSLTTAFGLDVYLRKPISENKIQREIEREARSA